MINIFNGPGNHNDHAFLNWRYSIFTKAPYDKFDVMSESYFDATQILLDNIIENNDDKRADSVIFSVLFSFHHYIEIKIKAIMNYYVNIEPSNPALIKYLGKTEEGSLVLKPYPNNEHNINQLFKELMKIIKSSSLKYIEKSDSRFEYLKSYLKQINKYQIFKDSPQLDFTRYPIGKKEKNYFYTDTNKNITISPINFKKISKHIELELSELFYQLENYE